jgi:hypothetical protein
VSNYRVRQVLAIKPKLLESKLRLMVALATWMNDDSMTAEVSFDLAMEQAQIARNTARDARKALAADGYLSWTSPHGRGNRTAWTFHKLPELKGVSDVDLFSEADVKGVSDADPLPAPEKGSAGPGKRGQPERADLQGRSNKLNRQANDDDARPVAAAAVAAEYGWPREHAERVIETIVARARKPVSDPARYVGTAIKRDSPASWAPDASRWRAKDSTSKRATQRTSKRQAPRLCEYDWPVAEDGTCCSRHAQQSRQQARST